MGEGNPPLGVVEAGAGVRVAEDEEDALWDCWRLQRSPSEGIRTRKLRPVCNCCELFDGGGGGIVSTEESTA